MTQMLAATAEFTSGITFSPRVTPERRRCVSVIGVQINDVPKSVAFELMERRLRWRSHVCQTLYIVNAHTLNLASQDHQYRNVLNKSDLVFNDGTGVRWAARQRGIRLHDNLNGTDLIPEFLAATGGRGYRYFMLGATPQTLQKAVEHTQREYPGWTLAGHHHGYVQGETEEAVIEAINAADVDLLLVGMGNPIQENWIHRNRSRLRVGLTVGVGGLFGHMVGEPRRAPLLVRKAGFEWLHKLARQPQKWRRYLLGNPLFLYRMTAALAYDKARMGI